MLLEIGLLKKKTNKKQQQKKTKNKNKTKQKPKKKKEKERITIALSRGPPSFYFYNKRYNMANGYIYHFLYYIKLLLFVNANVIHHV